MFFTGSGSGSETHTHTHGHRDMQTLMMQALALIHKDTNCDDRVSYTEFVKWLFHGSKEAGWMLC